MTDAALVAVVAVVPPTLAALGNLYVAVLNGQKVDAHAVQVTEQTDALHSQGAHITELVNSKMTIALQTIEEQKAEIHELKTVVSKLELRLQHP